MSILCLLDTGRALGCPGVGGLDEIYASNFAVRDYAFVGEIIQGTDAGDGPAQVFQTIQQDFEIAFASSNPTVENGAASFAHTVTFTLYNKGEKNLDDEIRSLRKVLSKGRFLLIAKDNNEVHKLYGKKHGMRLTTNEGGNGVANTDLNGYVFTFVSNEPELPRVVNLPGDGVGATIEFIINPAPLA